MLRLQTNITGGIEYIDRVELVTSEEAGMSIGNSVWDRVPGSPKMVSEYGYCFYNNKVYVVGGVFPETGEVSNELWSFDTIELEWTKEAIIPYTIRKCTVTGYGNSLFILGGLMTTEPNSATNQFMKYDLAARSWEAMENAPMIGHSGIFESINGFMFYGVGHSNLITNNFYAYDIINGGWQLLDSSPKTCNRSASVAIGNSIYVFGGSDNDLVGSRRVQVFNTMTGQWVNLGEEEIPYGGMDMGACTDGDHVYLSGGIYDGISSKPLQRLTLSSSAWTNKTSSGTDTDHGFCYLRYGNLYTASDAIRETIPYIERISVATPTNRTKLYMGIPERDGHAVVAFGDKIYSIGGRDRHANVNGDIWIYDLNTNALTRKYFGTPRRNAAVSVDGHNQRLVITGGIDGDGDILNDLIVYDTTNGSITEDGFVRDGHGYDLTAREGHVSVYSPSTKSTFIIGGMSHNGVYATRLGVWQGINSYTEAEDIGIQIEGARGAEINGYIYVFGGQQPSGRPGNMYIIDPISRKVAELPTPIPGRDDYNLFTWNDNLYIYGGNGDNGPLTDMWVYHTQSRLATPTPHAAPEDVSRFGLVENRGKLHTVGGLMLPQSIIQTVGVHVVDFKALPVDSATFMQNYDKFKVVEGEVVQLPATVLMGRSIRPSEADNSVPMTLSRANTVEIFRNM